MWTCGLLGWSLQEQVGLLLRLLEVASGDQQIGQVDAGLIIVRLQFDGATEFLIGGAPLLQLEKRQG